MDDDGRQDVEREAPSGKASLESLERGLAVLQAFSRENPSMTLSEVAQVTGLTRATARRIVLTLEHLGHVRSRGRHFSLTAKVLDLGWSYFSSLSVDEIARPVMQETVDALGESVSLGVLNLPHVVYVARIFAARHRLVVAGGPGTKLDAYATSLGQVLLADLEPDTLEPYLATVDLEAFTPHTVTSPEQLRKRLHQVAERQWATSDQELELGLRGVAVPVIGRDGRTVAALSTSVNAALYTMDDLERRCLPALRQAAKDISSAISRVGGRDNLW